MSIFIGLHRCVLFSIFCLIFSTAHAQASHVALGGVIGNKAMLVIDGAPPKTLAVGEEYHGIELLNVQGKTATIAMKRANGTTERRTLRVGEVPVTVNAPYPSEAQVNISQSDAKTNNAQRCVPGEKYIPVSNYGMFKTQGYINGRAVQFMVDTGATYISMDEKQAVALGIRNYEQGRATTMSTANGTVKAYIIHLDTVNVGGIELKNVPALVGGDQDILLLGNSFLSKLEVEMTTNQLILRQVCPAL